MALVELSHIKSLFTGETKTQPDPELFRELLVMVLARATDADAYTHPAEVDVVKSVIKEFLGEDISTSDVRIAALSELYESAPLERYISKVGPSLPKADRRKIIEALVEVLKADQRVASSEAHYFNMIASSLGMTFADIAGLELDD